MVAHFKNRGIDDPVENLETRFPSPQDACFGERVKVARYIRLAQPRFMHEVVHALLSTLQRDQQSQAARLSQCPKAGGYQLKGLGGHRRSFRVRTFHKGCGDFY
jgi:hypothetical protein